MKKFIILLFLVSNCLNLNSKCVKLFAYSKNDNVSHDIEVMKKYHSLYGRDDVDYENIYLTINYWADFYKIDLYLALSFFSIESGFTYDCKSNYGAVGMGQLTEVALKDYNNYYRESINFEKLNGKENYDINIKVSIGYMRLCLNKYNSIIKDTSDLIKSYNIGVGNLKKIKNGEYSVNNFWAISANKYSSKFNEVYSDFINHRR